MRTRDLPLVKEAFQDLLDRLETNYIDLGMIHYVDTEEEFNKIIKGEFQQYVQELKANGTIRHIGMSTHNPTIAKKAALSGIIEMILFSINPAFDMLPASDDLEQYFVEEYDTNLAGFDSLQHVEKAVAYETASEEEKNHQRTL